jgi:hypothetical protein
MTIDRTAAGRICAALGWELREGLTTQYNVQLPDGRRWRFPADVLRMLDPAERVPRPALLRGLVAMGLADHEAAAETLLNDILENGRG